VEFQTGRRETHVQLEKHHAKDGKTLFPGGEDAKGLMNFLRDWVDAEFAKEVRSMIGPKVRCFPLSMLTSPAHLTRFP